VANGIEVESDPSGASVFVNGRLAGSTPLNLGELKTGTYLLRLEKVGRAPTVQTLQVGESPIPQKLNVKLALLATGTLKVTIKPDGAEVLLDGERVGMTPLELKDVPVGTHDLLVRKTNFDPFPQRIEIMPNEAVAFGGFEMRDKMLAMLNGLVSSEPQRVNHYIDLAHYHFINGRMEEAAKAYADAQAAAAKPMDFPPEMSADERVLEMRLRSEDRARLEKELTKHRDPGYFMGKDTRLFKEKLAEEMDSNSRKNQGSWEWVEASTRDKIERGQYGPVEEIYAEFIRNNAEAKNNVPFLYALIKNRIALGKAQDLVKPVNYHNNASKSQPDQILRMGRMLSMAMRRQPPWSAADQEVVNKLARETLQQSYESAITGGAKGESAFELGQTYLPADPAQASKLLAESVTLAVSADDKVDRQLAHAEALRQDGKLDAAREIFEALTKHERADIQEKAKAGVLRVNAMNKK
jgi:hypothetical protein